MIPTRTGIRRPHALRLWSGGVVLALAGAFTLGALANDDGPRGEGRHAGAPPPMMMGPVMGGRMLDHMLDSINASDDQRTRIRKITDAAHDDLKAQRNSAPAVHEQATQLFAQPTVDANAAEALRQQMLAQHDQSSRRMLQAMLEISQVLTPEQRARLAQRMKERAERHGRGAGAPEPHR